MTHHGSPTAAAVPDPAIAVRIDGAGTARRRCPRHRADMTRRAGRRSAVVA
jgi:hypothetical protein